MQFSKSGAITNSPLKNTAIILDCRSGEGDQNETTGNLPLVNQTEDYNKGKSNEVKFNEIFLDETFIETREGTFVPIGDYVLFHEGAAVLRK